MRYLSVMACIVALLAGSGPVVAQEEGREIVLARVNEKIITRRDAEKLLRMTGEFERINGTYRGARRAAEMRKALKGALAFLIDEAVVGVNAGLEGVRLEEIDRKRAEMEFEEKVKRFGTLANCEAVLKEQGLSVEDVKERSRRKILIQKYLLAKLSADNYISPREAREYYEKNKSSYAKSEMVAIRQIVIKFGRPGRRKSTAIRLIENIKEKLKKSADFGTLAGQFSEGAKRDKGGLLSPVPVTELRKCIAEAVAGLKEGEVSGVIERGDAFLLVKLEKKDKPSYKPFEKALESITRKLEGLRRKEKLPELEKKLYSTVEIEMLYTGASLEQLCPAYSRDKDRQEENDKAQSPNDK